MATVLNFSGKTPSQRMCLKPMAGPAISSMAIKRTCQFEQNKRDALQHCIYVKRKAENKQLNDHRLFPVMAAVQRSSGIYPSSPSPSDTIKKFYKCINEKNLKQLGDYISEDCYIEECSFNTPLQGKKEVMNFFEQLITGMGQNVKFCIQRVCEGDELIGAANWHMEWKDKQIPYTRGCSFFEFSKKGEKIILKKAQIVIESPIKPGTVVLSLLKTVTALFDGFPKTTDWFLKSPHIVFQWLWKIYTILFAPIVDSYLRLWSLAARLLSYAYYIVLYIAKFFFK
ncbi:unnamed protein product [Prunus armeniaca]|uniref:SnoaL-like domain-containing protein n=1 Tax=Prunus armeniaca TaxID=36596 RepID=A0A6J5UVL8_PRUAR|nr:hypothetical protein GBA52_016767 [Prunus armeniaca]CAB4279963.1 unnamed protein product [Prunus armeniaca]